MTTEGQFDEFHARLEDAERRLLAMARSREDDDVPYWYLLGCARGLHRDGDVVPTRFDMLRKVAPDHRRGHSHVLRCVSPKWYGSPTGPSRPVPTTTAHPGGSVTATRSSTRRPRPGVDEGRHALEALQGRVSDYPWRYFADDLPAAYAATAEQLTG